MKEVCPDWKDARSYGFMHKHSLQEWGWEFIRRDENYIAEWKKVLSKFKNAKKRGHFSFDELTKTEFDYLCETSDYDYYYEYISNTSRVDFKDRFKFIIPDQAAHKWGMKNYQNPKCSQFNKFNLLDAKLVHFGHSLVNEEQLDTIDVEKSENCILAEIDLEKAITPQLERLEKKAREKQKKLKIPRKRAVTVTNNSRDVWIKYLRCIDAQRLGVARIPAAEIIFQELKPKHEWDEPLHLPAWDSARTKIQNYKSKNYSNFMA